jgi:hypothetical protein
VASMSSIPLRVWVRSVIGVLLVLGLVVAGVVGVRLARPSNDTNTASPGKGPSQAPSYLRPDKTGWRGGTLTIGNGRSLHLTTVPDGHGGVSSAQLDLYVGGVIASHVEIPAGAIPRLYGKLLPYAGGRATVVSQPAGARDTWTVVKVGKSLTTATVAKGPGGIAPGTSSHADSWIGTNLSLYTRALGSGPRPVYEWTPHGSGLAASKIGTVCQTKKGLAAC